MGQKPKTQLRESGVLAMPSEKQLALYKNSITQKPGISADMLQWMVKEADRMGLPPLGYCGGLLMDEVSIQEDLQCFSKSAKTQLIGFVDLGSAHYLYQQRHGLYRHRSKTFITYHSEKVP